ncbi:hypothetical protein ABZ540_18415 [Nocardia xishanensis]|uniref:hypothetical protein n=1 Tax=Nocardia xishanensis TaxID=238964 RepID=UPI0033E84E48
MSSTELREVELGAGRDHLSNLDSTTRNSAHAVPGGASATGDLNAAADAGATYLR